MEEIGEKAGMKKNHKKYALKVLECVDIHYICSTQGLTCAK